MLDWNTSAIGFYESLWAKAMNDWTTFRLTDTALADLAATEHSPQRTEAATSRFGANERWLIGTEPPYKPTST